MTGPRQLPLSVTSSVLIPAVFASDFSEGPGLRLAPWGLVWWGRLCQCSDPLPPCNPATGTGSWVATVSLVTNG